MAASLATNILIIFCHVGSFVCKRWYAGSWSSCVVDVRRKGWVFLSEWWVVFVLLNLPERFLLLTKQTKNESWLPVGQCNMVPEFYHDEELRYFIPTSSYILCMKRICFRPRGTSRQLMLMKMIPMKKSWEIHFNPGCHKIQEQTAIFDAIDCKGSVPCH